MKVQVKHVAKLASIEDLETLRKRLQDERDKQAVDMEVLVCTGGGCIASGSSR